VTPDSRFVPSPATALLARVEIAAPRRSGVLSVWPLVALDSVLPPPGVAHVALATAVVAGQARVEIPPGRSYRTLRATVENAGDVALLLLAGEAPIAARPRWRVAKSALVAPHTTLEFLVRSVPAQDAPVAAIIGALSAPPLERQLGFVAATRKAVVGLEVAGRSDVFASAQAALIEPYARIAGAPELARNFEAAPPESAESLIELAMAARCVTEPSGAGAETLRLHGRGVIGRGLAHGSVLQLSARWLDDRGEPLVDFA
jgi:hypothetical protein